MFQMNSSLGPIEEEKLKNQFWLKVVGRRYISHIYEIEYVDHIRIVLKITYNKHKYIVVTKLIPKKLINKLSVWRKGNKK